MRNSRVLFNNITNSTVPIMSFANQIMYPFVPNQNFILRIIHKAFTKFYLSQAKNYFPDFQVNEFSKIAEKVYLDAAHCTKSKKRIELSQLVTPPIVDMIKISLKNNADLPFRFHNKVVSMHIEHARVSLDSDDNSSKVKFIHITTRLIFDEQGKQQLVTFERRLDNKFRDSWRICFLEDLNSDS